jgi:hypothetical protein
MRTDGLKNTWLRQQGRGAKSYRLCRPIDWWCDGCKKFHKPSTDRFITLDNRNLCTRQFVKEG